VFVFDNNGQIKHGRGLAFWRSACSRGGGHAVQSKGGPERSDRQYDSLCRYVCNFTLIFTGKPMALTLTRSFPDPSRDRVSNQAVNIGTAVINGLLQSKAA